MFTHGWNRGAERGTAAASHASPAACLFPSPPRGDGPLTFFALLAHPAIHAGLVAILVTGVVAKEVVPGPAELVAGGTVVVLITAHSDLQLQVCHVAAEVQALPAVLRVDHASMGHPLNQQLLFGSSRVSQQQRLPGSPPGCHTDPTRQPQGQQGGQAEEGCHPCRSQGQRDTVQAPTRRLGRSSNQDPVS